MDRQQAIMHCCYLRALSNAAWDNNDYKMHRWADTTITHIMQVHGITAHELGNIYKQYGL